MQVRVGRLRRTYLPPSLFDISYKKLSIVLGHLICKDAVAIYFRRCFSLLYGVKCKYVARSRLFQTAFDGRPAAQMELVFNPGQLP